MPAPQARSLAELRAERGITQVEVARRMGIAQETVSGIERSANVTIGTLRRYLQALDAKLVVEADVAGERVPLRAVGQAPEL